MNMDIRFVSQRLLRAATSRGATMREQRPRGNLPARLTSFIGREHEQTEVEFSTQRWDTFSGAPSASSAAAFGTQGVAFRAVKSR